MYFYKLKLTRPKIFFEIKFVYFLMNLFHTFAAHCMLAFNLKSLNNNASALIEARSQSAGVRSALKNV
jgi:hypothetical protein